MLCIENRYLSRPTSLKHQEGEVNYTSEIKATASNQAFEGKSSAIFALPENYDQVRFNLLKLSNLNLVHKIYRNKKKRTNRYILTLSVKKSVNQNTFNNIYSIHFTCVHETSVKIFAIYSRKPLVLPGAVDSSPPLQLIRKVTSTPWVPLLSSVRSRS